MAEEEYPSRTKKYLEKYGRISKKLYINEDMWTDLKREIKKVKRELEIDKPILVLIGEFMEKKIEEDGISARTEEDSEFLEKLEENLSGKSRKG